MKTNPATSQCTLSSEPKLAQMGMHASGWVFGIKSLADEICRLSRIIFSGLTTAIGARPVTIVLLARIGFARVQERWRQMIGYGNT